MKCRDTGKNGVLQPSSFPGGFVLGFFSISVDKLSLNLTGWAFSSAGERSHAVRGGCRAGSALRTVGPACCPRILGRGGTKWEREPHGGSGTSVKTRLEVL